MTKLQAIENFQKLLSVTALPGDTHTALQESLQVLGEPDVAE